MRAFGLSLGVLVTSIGLTVIPVGSAAADTESREGSFPVPAGPSHGETGSGVLLKGGVTYRIAVTGSVSQSAGADGFTTDALYCYQGSAPDSPCNQHYPIGAEALGLAFRTPGFREPDSSEVKSLADFGTNKSIAYDDGHHYDQFVSPASDVYLFAMTFPGKNPGGGVSYGGEFTITINRVIPGPGTGPPPGSNGTDVDCVIRHCTPSFGPNLLYSAPMPGALFTVPAPTLPKTAKQATLTLSLPGAQPTPVTATTPVIIKDRIGLLVMCMFWGGESAKPGWLDDEDIDDRDSNFDAALFQACWKLLAIDSGQITAHGAAGSCRATFIPVALRGTRITEAKRRKMVASAKKRVRASCRRSSDGGMKAVLGARGKGKTVRSLIRRSKPKLVLVRGPAQQADPPSARIGVRWGH